jgi:hypothetical protein
MSYTTINKSTEHFNTKLYTGNATNNTSITGVGFQPDLLWIKDRTNNNNHSIQDAVRGAGYNMQTNTTNAEGLATETISSFDTDGWTMNNGGGVNGSGAAFAAWNWLASNTTASNTDGSITSTVSANTTSGFSIVSYTGTGSNATVGHGLGVAPKMYICKSRSSARSWAVYNENIGNTKALFLNTSDAQDTDATYWNSTSPTNSVVSLGSRSEMNHSGENFVMYCFAEKKGFSKFGSYTGNGNADGTFVYTGFKPAFVIAKGNSAGYQWSMCDNKRGTANTSNGEFLFAESSGSTNFATNNWDFLSNGFKARADYAAMNSSGISYIYMAFAEAPLVGSNNVPCTAR